MRQTTPIPAPTTERAHGECAATRPVLEPLTFVPTGPLAPWARRFAGVSIAIAFAAIVGVLVPFWFGADPELLLAIIPIASWVPAVAAIGVLLAMRRPVPLVRTLAIWPLRPAGRVWAGLGVVTLVVSVVAALTVLLPVAAGVVRWEPLPDAALTALLILPLVPVTMLSTLGEELLWRGALQTALAPWGWWRSSVAIGAVWTLWHAPLLATYVATGSMTGEQAVVTSGNLLLASIVLGAVRAWSGSVWPAVLGHALLNTVLVYATSNLTTSADALDDAARWLHAGLGWLSWGLAIGAIFWLLVGGRSRAHGRLAA